MKQFLFMSIAMIFIAACNTSKKSTATALPPLPVPSYPLFVKPADGVYAPGEEELNAIRSQPEYSEVTLEKLKTGYHIYAKGACINCHGTSNIYTRNEAQWKSIIDDMSERASLSSEQRDAVYQYVLAIKAVQSKE